MMERSKITDRIDQQREKTIKEKEIKENYICQTKEGRLMLKVYKKGLEVTGYEGEDIRLDIPNEFQINDKSVPVISVGKKAFLSSKNLRVVIFHEAVTEVSDWAFAYCDNLREVYLPRKTITFGRGLFRECNKLRKVQVEGTHADIGGLMAAAVTLLDAAYLFSPMQAGNEEWLAQWDSRMLLTLHKDDKEGYSKLLLCGEEDYGSKENNMDYFLNQKRKSKVRIAFMRLLNPFGISEQTRKELEKYLLDHTKGEASEETWQVLHDEHGDDSEYYKLFTQIGCLSADNFDSILTDIGTEYAEMKAYFMRYKEEQIGYTDFFNDILTLF